MLLWCPIFHLYYSSCWQIHAVSFKLFNFAALRFSIQISWMFCTSHTHLCRWSTCVIQARKIKLKSSMNHGYRPWTSIGVSQTVFYKNNWPLRSFSNILNGLSNFKVLAPDWLIMLWNLTRLNVIVHQMFLEVFFKFLASD